MYKIMEFLFINIIPLLIIGFIIYVIYVYKQLSNIKEKMQHLFDKTLNNYLGNKIKLANDTSTKIINEYGREDAIRTEIIRLRVIIEKGINGSITDIVNTSNVINKYQVSKEIDIERYPYFKELENIKTFYDIELDSITDDIALARKDYNDLARQYNELAGSSLMQYIVKILNIETQFPVFEHINQERYSDRFEELEIEEPEINKISNLNMVQKQEEQEEQVPTPNANPTPDIQIEHTKGTFKPTKM